MPESTAWATFIFPSDFSRYANDVFVKPFVWFDLFIIVKIILVWAACGAVYVNSFDYFASVFISHLESMGVDGYNKFKQMI